MQQARNHCIQQDGRHQADFLRGLEERLAARSAFINAINASGSKSSGKSEPSLSKSVIGFTFWARINSSSETPLGSRERLFLLLPFVMLPLYRSRGPLSFFVLPGSRGLPLLDRRMRRRQPCDRHTERRAAHIIQINRVTKLHALGIAAVLAADAALELRPR